MIALISSPMVSTATVMEPAGSKFPATRMADLALVLARIARQEQSALAELYDETAASVYGLALKIVRDATTAEEITAHVFAQAWSKASSFDPARGGPMAWLMSMTRNRAIDVLRMRRREPTWTELGAADQVSDPGPDPEEGLSLDQRRRLVRTVLASLPVEQRELIELAYFGGFSHGQIAARLALPLGTIKTRIRAAMTRMRAQLTAQGSFGGCNE